MLTAPQQSRKKTHFESLTPPNADDTGKVMKREDFAKKPNVGLTIENLDNLSKGNRSNDSQEFSNQKSDEPELKVPEVVKQKSLHDTVSNLEADITRYEGIPGYEILTYIKSD